MKVEWSAQARSDLLDIFHRIAPENPAAARKLLARLRHATVGIRGHPLIGRVVPEFEVANIRERIVRPYRLIYQVQMHAILVLTVIHGRRSLDHIGQAAFVIPDEPEDPT